MTWILQKCYHTEIRECSFENCWNVIQTTSVSSATLLIIQQLFGFKNFWPIWAYKIEPACFVPILTLKHLKQWAKKQLRMRFTVINLKIKIFRDFRGFVLSPIPINKHLELTEILQKGHNNEMWKCWNAVQITSN